MMTLAILLKLTCLVLSIIGITSLDILKTLKLNGEDKLLQRYIIDPRNGLVYLTANNTLYVRYSDLQPVISLTLGPKNDSEYCSPFPNESCVCKNSTSDDCVPEERSPQDNINKALALDTFNNALIMCSNLYYGYCSKLRLDDYSIDESYFIPVVLNSLVGNTIVLVSEGTNSHHLYVAASRDLNDGVPSFKNEAHMLSRRNLDDFSLSHVDSSTGTASFLDVRPELRDHYPVHYEYGFTYNGYSYFLGIRPKSEKDNTTVSFLARLCNNDVRLRSFVEIVLKCGDHNRLVSAKLAKIGSKLAHDMDFITNEEVVYANFVNTGTSFDIPGDVANSAMCLYSMSEIEKQLKNLITLCFSGIGNLGPDYIIKSNEKCRSDIEPVYCGENGDGENWPIAAIANFYGEARYEMTHSQPGAYPTTMAITTTPGLDGNFTLVYLGFFDGSLVKGIIESRNLFTPFAQHNIGDGSPIKRDLTITHDNLMYAFTEKKMMLLSLFNCSKYTSCDECVRARDPHCGWCGLQNRCTQRYECEITHHALGWLTYPATTCPLINSAFPDRIIQYETNLTSISLTFGNIPPISDERLGDLRLTCELYGEGYSRSSQASLLDETSVNCTPFDPPPPLDMDISVQEAWVALNVVSSRWLTTSITIYNCHNRHSCDACVQPDLPCVWCLKSNLCVNRRTDCENQAAINSEQTPSTGLSAADRTGPQFCPMIVKEDRPDEFYVTAAGVPITVEVHGRNLFAYHQTGLRCTFEHRNGMVVNATYSNNKITCMDISLTYDGTSGSIEIPLQVSWDSNKTIDNPQNIAVTVYKCGMLGPNCGECTLLDPVYGCGWCENRCTKLEQCTGGATWLTTDDICPGPQIIDFKPKLGPYQGGTYVQITGVNLGKSYNDVRDGVRLGGRPCTVIEDQYIPSQSIVCETTGQVHESAGVVEVKIRRHSDLNITAQSIDTFRFTDPILVTFSPKQGLVSGGTKVTLEGDHLQIGNGVLISMNDIVCNVTSISTHQIEFITAPQESAVEARIKIKFDKTKTSELHSFTFLNNPVITGIEKATVLASGGTAVTLVGQNMHPSIKPVMVMRPANRVGGGRRKRQVEVMGVQGDNTPAYGLEDLGEIRVMCHSSTEESMQCPLPRLSLLALGSHPDSPTLLEYDVIIDDWRMSDGTLTPDDLDYQPISVYPDPVIVSFETDMSYVAGSENHMVIQGENLHVFHQVPGMQVLVGNTSSEILSIEPEAITFVAPSDPKTINDAGNSEVLVTLGDYKTSAGFVKYRTATEPQEESKVMLGILIGVIFTILIIGVVLVIVLRRRKRKEALPMRVNNGSIVERTDRSQNVYGIPGDKDSEAVPLKTFKDEPQGSGGEEEEDQFELQKPFELSDFLERIRDPKLRESVREVIVPPERLEMKEMIGRGNFGCVYLAVLKGIEDENYKNTCRVAVKTLQGERLEQATVESFLKEGVIMKNFDHPHVLKLLGVCVPNHENPMVVLPYMSNGDLRSYVKDKKKNFTARQLLHLAQQVAEGMAYLSSLNFVHRDLAARNCMIDELDDVKVADFGLTRDLFEKQYFSTNLKEKRGKMPIKWMAIESLEEFVFTTKSDVWSFGVLMWELMTRGVTPYPDVDIFDVRNYLAAGRRLRKPKYCPENIYKIMQECWHADPDIRPSFIDLVNRIELLLNPPRKRESEEPFEPMYMNIRKTNSTEYLRPTETPGV